MVLYLLKYTQCNKPYTLGSTLIWPTDKIQVANIGLYMYRSINCELQWWHKLTSLVISMVWSRLSSFKSFDWPVSLTKNKAVFSIVPRLSTWYCPHLLLSIMLGRHLARRVPLLLSAGACYRSISPARRALSCKPATYCCCCRSMGQTDGRSTVS